MTRRTICDDCEKRIDPTNGHVFKWNHRGHLPKGGKQKFPREILVCKDCMPSAKRRSASKVIIEMMRRLYGYEANDDAEIETVCKGCDGRVGVDVGVNTDGKCTKCNHHLVNRDAEPRQN